jgi:hypothetical protein
MYVESHSSGLGEFTGREVLDRYAGGLVVAYIFGELSTNFPRMITELVTTILGAQPEQLQDGGLTLEAARQHLGEILAAQQQQGSGASDDPVS